MDESGDLVIRHVLASDEGRYQCVAHNMAATRESPAVLLSVFGKRNAPLFEIQFNFNDKSFFYFVVVVIKTRNERRRREAQESFFLLLSPNGLDLNIFTLYVVPFLGSLFCYCPGAMFEYDETSGNCASSIKWIPSAFCIIST